MQQGEDYRFLFERNPLPMYLFDIATLKFLDVNEAAIRHYGYSRQEFLDMSLLDIRPASEHERFRESLRHPAGESNNAGEWIHLRKDGTRLVSLVYFNVVERNGRQLRLCAIHDATARAEVEQRLRDSEEHFRTLVSNVPDVILIMDRAGKILFINRVRENFKMEDVLGQSSFDFMDKDTGALQRNALERIFETGESSSYEVYAGGQGNSWNWYLVRLLPLRKEGAVWAALSIATDITARRNTEDALRASEARSRMLIEEAIDGIFVNDAAGRYTDVNDAGCEMMGYSRAEILSRAIPDLLVEAERDAVQPELARVQAGETSSRVWSFKRRDGTQFSGEVRARLLPDGRIQAVVRDITARQKAEQELRASQNFIEHFKQTAPYIVYVFDNVERRTVWTNRPFMLELGYTPQQIEEMGANSIFLLLHPDDQHHLQKLQSRWAGVPDGVVLTLEYRVRHASGAWRWVLSRDVIFARNPDGSVRQILGSLEDITDRKNLEEQILQSNKLDSIGRLAGGIAHDFNNLLTSILGHLELAGKDIEPDSPLTPHLQVIRLAAERSAELTRQLLAFARKQIIQPRVVELNGLVQETQRLLLRLIGENIELKAVLSPSAGLVKIDPGQISQVLINLAVNARDAMPSGGKLTIETDCKKIKASDSSVELTTGDYAMLSVRDTGSGMSEAVRQHLFEPFFTTKGVGQGTGLGLATCYGIIKQAGGHIDVKTEAGKGSEFIIYLPSAKGCSLELPKLEVPVLSKGTETVLLVEDDDMLRKLATQFLQSQGYTVVSARNGEEALNVSAKHTDPIHVLLTDVVMPRMNGTRLAESLRELRPTLKVILMSGYTDENLAGFDKQRQFSAILQKPFTLPQLAEQIRKVLK